MAVAQYALEHKRRQTEKELTVAQAAVAPLRQAKAETARKRAAIARIRGQSEACQALEQTDTPLAILQVVGDCCHALGHKIQLASLRIDESGDANAATPRQHNAPRKQLLLTGRADDDTRVSALVSQLRISRAFQRVELEASQAQTDQATSQCAFQIRCQQ